MATLAVDIETRSLVDLGKHGVYKYAEDPEFTILLLAYSLDGGPVRVVDVLQRGGIPKELTAMLTDPAVTKTAYNANFERTCLARYLRQPMPPEQWECTMVRALEAGLPGSLRDAAMALGLPADRQKDRRGKALIKMFCQPTKPSLLNGGSIWDGPHSDPGSWGEFIEYCRQDVVVEMAVRDSTPPLLPQEQRLWEIDQTINDRGVQIDLALAEGAVAIDEVITTDLMERARDITQLANPNSRSQLLEWINDQSITDEEFTTLRKEDLKHIASACGSDIVREVLDIRAQLSRAAQKKYTAMLTDTSADGRARGLTRFYGAATTGRWSGSRIQLQNLKRNSLPDRDMDDARSMVRRGDAELMHLIYDDPTEILGQLVRTALVPRDGCRFVISDFSAIEARVLAWLAGEQWRLDVFNGGGKLYETSASMMFGVPVEKIVHGQPEYALRQKGKQAELACGYSGSVGALKKMGALKMGLAEAELPGLVKQWRAASPHIVAYWDRMERAAMACIQKQQPTAVGSPTTPIIRFEIGKIGLSAKLPSGRRIIYRGAHLRPHSKWKGKMEICYQTNNPQRPLVSTYGGKLVENCLGGQTLVLTPAGWKPLQTLTTADRVWDGTAWIAHKGLVPKGLQQTLDLDGVHMTPDHKVYTEGGWKSASSCTGYHRCTPQLPDGCGVRRLERQEVSLENPLRLRQNLHYGRLRVSEGQAEIMRVHAEETDRRETSDPQNVATSTLSRLALHERALHMPDRTSVEELRGTGNQGVRTLDGKLREFPGRYGPELPDRIDTGQDRRKRELLPGKLPVGLHESPGQKQKKQPDHRHAKGPDDGSRSSGHVRHQSNDSVLQIAAQLPAGQAVCQAGRYEQVYDLLDCGPKHCFTVLGNAGPMLVHNCTQAVARDCLAVAMARLEEAGCPIVFHVHDECVCEMPHGVGGPDLLAEIMSRPIEWAPGLPLNAAAFENSYYKKD